MSKEKVTKSKKCNTIKFFIRRCSDGKSFDIFLKIKLNHCFMVSRREDLYSVRIETEKITRNIISFKKHVDVSKICLEGLEYPEKLYIHFFENGVYVNITLFKKFYMSKAMYVLERKLEREMEDIIYMNRSPKTYSPSAESLITPYIFTNIRTPFRG